MARPSLSTAALTGSLLLGAGVVVHDATNHRSPETEKAPQALTALALEADGPCAVIQRFGALASDYKPAAQTHARAPRESADLHAHDELQMPPGCQPHLGEIRYIIATVPHPTRT